MNFSIKIYPYNLIPFSKDWRDIKREFSDLSKGVYREKLDFNLIESNKDYSRLILGDLERLRIYEPSQILKTVEKGYSDFDEGEKKVSIRNIYSRKLEFEEFGKLIYWNIDFGIKELYDVDGEIMEVVQERMLSDELFDKYKKALNRNHHLLSLETDLITELLDPIWILALLFSRMTNGIAFVEHSFSDYILKPGYYQVSELKTICTSKYEF